VVCASQFFVFGDTRKRMNAWWGGHAAHTNSSAVILRVATATLSSFYSEEWAQDQGNRERPMHTFVIVPKTESVVCEELRTTRIWASDDEEGDGW
jgi:hypothetical protein